MHETVVDDPLIGKQLGNYRLERVIGRGGMALVYKGVDVKLHRPVAVKVIDARYRNNKTYAERFIRESRVVASWRHDNILQIYYADDQDGLYYFAMEYVNGLDLRQIVDLYGDEGRLMPISDVLGIGYALADALDYAHNRGIVHRDIKPSNVMVSHDGRVLLMDFGLALEMTEGSKGQVFGTPHYMAPEQVRRSADAVPQSDIYSLGVLLFEMLTGSVPFEDEQTETVAFQHVTEPPPSPREINPNLNLATEGVLLKALAKAPEDRYRSGKALLDALKSALEEDDFEPDALPPPPAATQNPFPAPGSAAEGAVHAPAISDMTVAEKIALQLGPHPTHPSKADRPSQSGQKGKTEVAFGAFQINRKLGFAILAAVLAIALGVAAFFTFRGDHTGLPAAVSPAETGDSAAVVDPTPTATATQMPSPPATATPEPPAATPTPRPTEAPAVAQEPTRPPVSTDVPTPAPTHTPLSEPSLLLIYNQSGFYVQNVTDREIDLGPLSFNALDEESNPTRYAVQVEQDWPFTDVDPGYCGAIEINSRPHTRPRRCDGFNSVDTPGADSPKYFWADRSDQAITRFRVAWFGQTLQTCVIFDGFCAVRLPR